MKQIYEYGTIITRKHPTLFFGQPVDILGFNEFSDELVIKPHGDSKKYNVDTMKFGQLQAQRIASMIN